MFAIPRPAEVRPVCLSELAPYLSASASHPDVGVTGVSLASAKVEPGDLYAALPGARRHGAEFIGEAVERGAVAVLTDEAGAEVAREHDLPTLLLADPRAAVGPAAALVYGDPTKHLRVIGITGTNGKTSTAYLIEAGLRAAGRRTGLIGTVEIRMGDDVLVSERTTPEAPELQALFAHALESGVTDVVMEVSSHALALHRADGIHFTVGGFTMFGLDHLDFHHGVEDYFASKAKLFDGRCATEVINIDDAWASRLVNDKTVTYSLTGAAATWMASDITGIGFDQSFDVSGPGVDSRAFVRVPGAHNVANALLAYACLTATGVPGQVAIEGVAQCLGVPGRMELVSGDHPVRGVVDYAHKPEAVVAVLKALRPITAGRIIAVLGAGGDRDPGKRKLMGEAAGDGADLVIVTDDNPRTEDPAHIRSEVLAGVGARAHIEVPGRGAAVDEAVSRARPGDTIALLGKGHEQGQELDTSTVPFDDRLVLADALAAAHH